MKRAFWVLPAVLLFLWLPSGVQAQTQMQTQAQETLTTTSSAEGAPAKDPASGIPEWEIGGGYSFMRANVHGTGPSFNMNGGFATISENLNSWFGGRFDFNAWGGTLNGTNVSAQSYTYGPVFSHRMSRSTFFGTAQFGAVHASEGFLGISQSANKFAMSFNGGVDYRIGKHAAIRFEGGYLMTRFLSMRQDNFQAGAGLVFYLGKK